MKKLLAVLISLSVMAGSAFARGTYNGDVQLHIGTGQDKSDVKGDSIDIAGIKDVTFDVDVESWHLFSLNDLFSVGFMVGFNGGIGATNKLEISGFGELDSGLALHFNGLIGPAVGFSLGNISAINVSAGLAFGGVSYEFKHPDLQTTVSTGAVGFGLEANGKFFPKNAISPLIGFRFSFLNSKKYNVDSTMTISGTKVSHSEKDLDCDSFSIFNSEFFVGVAFNF